MEKQDLQILILALTVIIQTIHVVFLNQDRIQIVLQSILVLGMIFLILTVLINY